MQLPNTKKWPGGAGAPTPYPEVNEVLEMLLTNVQAVLGERFVGLYLYGSLAGGGFEPGRSDIDFLVVTSEALPDTTVAALGAMHARIAHHGPPWARKLEGSYLPLPALRRYDPDGAYPSINEGVFEITGHGSDWIIQRHVLREGGASVAGPSLRPFIDPVPPEALWGAVRALLREWWAPMLEEPGRLRSAEYQAYAVLTMCRALYTLEHATMVSKARAAQWAQGALHERWSSLIQEALAWRHGQDMERREEVLDFIRYTLARSRGREV
ncbi:MAG: aminoglycoside adenylyltransferase domain-containing protein [Anaerolineales bacterium]